MATTIVQKTVAGKTTVSQHSGVAGAAEVSQKTAGTATPNSGHSGLTGYTEVTGH